MSPVEAVSAELLTAAFPGAEGPAQRYAALLVDEAIPFGLLGPREADVLWTRHLLNCAVASELVPEGADILDVGSGAGLPGIPLALACPSSTVTLVEPLLRRATWLMATVEALGLRERVRVIRGRIEEQRGELTGDVVTARAVAELGRLVGWCAPAVRAGGQLLALRGERAAEELHAAQPVLRTHAGVGEVVTCGATLLATPTTVVRIRFHVKPVARPSRRSGPTEASRRSKGARR